MEGQGPERAAMSGFWLQLLVLVEGMQAMTLVGG